MAGNSMARLYEKKEVRDYIVSELRKRVREDRPPQMIIALSVLRVEEQIEKTELHLATLRAELEFKKGLDPSMLEEKES